MVTVVNTVFAEETDAPEVIVYVNEAGVPVSTSTEHLHSSATSTFSASRVTVAPTPVVAPVAAAVVPSAPAVAAPPAANPASAPAAAAAPAPASSSSAPAPAESSASSSSVAEGSGYGFSYSPYSADGSCKSQDQVNSDLASIGSGYSLVRIYGTDCNQVSTVLAAAKTHGFKLFAGIFDLGSLSSEIATIVSAANGDWSQFHTVSIGNELVNSGTASAATVVAAIGTARGLLKAAGYTGHVVTVDTLVAARANPSLCDASDYCAVNCHPFFDGNTVAANAGSFLTTQIPTLQAVLANKSQQVVVTETGWPWQGDANGVAVPSPANQAAALGSIKGAFTSTPEAVILFTPYNDLWKQNSPAQFNAEQYWGFVGNAPSG